MGKKTSQLQIRVTEEEKATLRRMAAAAGLSVSRYVLAQTLPSAHREIRVAIQGLAAARGRTRSTLEELARLLTDTPPGELDAALADPPLEALNPVLQNQVAALVEQAAHVKSVEPPGWVDEVAPPPRPHFGWPLSSLRPHQIRVTPVPFKRRGIFFEPSSPRGVPIVAAPVVGRAGAAEGGGEEPLRRLATLAEALHDLELKVEFYLVGGAILSTTFQARPKTAHVSALFGEAVTTREAIRDLGEREGWPADWLTAAVKLFVGGIRSDRYLELPSLSVFVPQLEYLLALEVAALRVGSDGPAVDDLRYVLRASNLTSAEAALQITRRYFGDRQLAPGTRAVLERLLAA